jgi:hypothetical protein
MLFDWWSELWSPSGSTPTDVMAIQIFFLIPAAMVAALLSPVWRSHIARAVSFLIADALLLLAWFSFESNLGFDLLGVVISFWFLLPAFIGGMMAISVLRARASF